MSKVYAIRNDYTKYQDLDLLLHDVTRHAPDEVGFDEINNFSLTNLKMASWWVTPSTSFDTNAGFEDVEIPDISQWDRGTLILSPKAYRLLGDILKTDSDGEFLPVDVEGETFYIFNCFVFGEEKSVKFDHYDGKPIDLVELTFTQEATENLLLKSKSQNCVTLFCNDRFKSIVHSFDLKGVNFDDNLLLPSLSSMINEEE